MHARVLPALALALALSACATRPESISASYVSHEKYAGLSCERLNARMSDARSNLEKFSQMQDTKANVDAATVFLVLIPLSKLSGDSAADVAKWKGEVEAIETAQVRAGCKSVD